MYKVLLVLKDENISEKIKRMNIWGENSEIPTKIPQNIRFFRGYSPKKEKREKSFPPISTS